MPNDRVNGPGKEGIFTQTCSLYASSKHGLSRYSVAVVLSGQEKWIKLKYMESVWTGSSNVMLFDVIVLRTA